MSNDLNRHRIAAYRYIQHPFNEEGVCSYCGAPASSVDHVPPIVMTYMLSDLEARKRFRHYLVNSCRECNILLGTFSGTTLRERRMYLWGRYKLRYENLLRTPHWTLDQLLSLGPNLQKYIKNKSELKMYISRRLSRLSE